MAKAEAVGARGSGGGFGRRAARGARLGAALALALIPGCCLVSPPDAKTIMEAGNAGWRSPEAAFETFRVAFGSELDDLQYRSFSKHFREEHGLTALNYRLARRKLLDEKPWLVFLVEARVVDQAVISQKRHRIVAEVRGRRFEVELVREDGFQIYSGDGFLADGPLDWAQAVQVRTSEGEQELLLRLRVAQEDLEGKDLSTSTSVRAEGQWKIERLGDLATP